MDFLIGNDTAVITLLLLFISLFLTKRIVPWWTYEDVLKRLEQYEEAAPELVTEVHKLMELLQERETQPVRIKTNPRQKPRRREVGNEQNP